MDVFDLVATLTLNTDDYDQGLKNAQGKLNTAGSKMKNAFGTVAKAGGLFTGAVVAGGAAIFSMSKKSADTADHIDKMSQKIGISREAYQEFDFIASQSGADVDQLRMGMKTLTSQMGSAVSGTGSAADAFKTLGISVTDSEGNMKSQEDMLWETLDALQGVQNQTERAALANQLFGKSGSDLMPLINGARGSIHDMRDEAHELGLVMGDETIDAGVKLTDTIDKVQRSFGVIVTKIGAEVMPIVQNVLDMVLENMPTIQSVMSSVFDVISKVVGTFIDVLKSLYDYVQENIVPVLSDVWSNTIQPAISNAFSAIQEAWTNVLQPALQAIWSFITETLAPAVKTAWEETIKPAIISVFDAVSEAWTNVLKPALDALWTFVTETLAPQLKTAFEALQSTAQTVFEAISGFWENTLSPALSSLWTFVKDTLVPELNTAFETLKGVAEPVFEAIKTAVSTAFDTIKNLWENPLKGVFSKIGSTIGELKEKFSAMWEKTGGIKSIVEGVISAIKTAWDEVLSPVIEAIGSAIKTLKNTFETVWKREGGISQIINNVWTSIKHKWDEVLAPVWEGISSAVTALKETFSTVWNSIKETVESVWGAIQTAWNNTLGPVFENISSGIEAIQGAFDSVLQKAQAVFGTGDGSIYGTIIGVIDKIKGVFDFDWSLPEPRLPSIEWGWKEVIGGFSVPWFWIQWNRKAYDNPFMFTDPTVLGNYGFGDGNGGEIVYGHDNLMRDIREATAGNKGNFSVTINVTQNPNEDQEAFAERVGEIIAQQYDRQEAVFA